MLADRRNRYPRWIAGSGDIVRALLSASTFDDIFDYVPTLEWMLAGVRRDGHIATAQGFERIVPTLSHRDQFADEIGVVGWCDKAFRVMSQLVDGDQAAPTATVPNHVSVRAGAGI